MGCPVPWLAAAANPARSTKPETPHPPWLLPVLAIQRPPLAHAAGGAQSPHCRGLAQACSRCFHCSPALREGEAWRGTRNSESNCPSSQLPSVGLPGRPLPPGSPGTAARPPPGLPELPLRPSEASAWSSGSVAWTRAAGPVTADGWAAGRLARARVAAGPWASPAAPTVRLTAVSTAGLCWRRGRHVYL